MELIIKSEFKWIWGIEKEASGWIHESEEFDSRGSHCEHWWRKKIENNLPGSLNLKAKGAIRLNQIE